jgi:RecB family exonuclease
MRTRNLYQPGARAPFKLSRSKLEAFQNCPRCFYLDRRLGIEPPGGPPFTLNSAVDALLKKEFDRYRAKGEPHPYMTKAGLDAIPYAHPKLDEWRQNFKGVRHVHKDSGFDLSGAIDDLWQDRATGDIIVADYKATAKTAEVSLDADWQISYKRQMEFYQWLLRQNGLRVSRTGYFVYCNGDVSADGFDNMMRFKVSLLPYVGDTAWVEPTLSQARACLEAKAPPPPTKECDQCAYLADVATLGLR